MSSIDFKSVRDRYPLAFFFESTLGAVLHKISGNVRYSACPNPYCGKSSDASFKVSVLNDKWKCFACNKTGDVIDAASMFFSIPFLEAAKQLSGQDIENEPSYVRISQPKPKVERNQEAINLAISKLLDAQGEADPAVVAYLESRCIPKAVCDMAVARQIVITLPGDPNEALRYVLDVVGEELLKQSGLWKKNPETETYSRCPAIIYRPLGFVSADQRGIEFKLIVESGVTSAKSIRYGDPSPSVWKGNEHVMITEGFTDLLSAIALGSERTIYGIPGANNWNEEDEWLDDLSGRHVLTALDDDEAGIRGTERFTAVLTPKGAKVKRHVLPEGINDLNDQLKAISQ